ncbi:MAG: hypothetical protein ACRDKH_09585 [Solirubrobacterales bacterium]
MRKRKFLTGAVLGVVASLAVSGVASAAVSNQTYSSTAAKKKQDRKVRGPVGTFRTDVDTFYAGGFTPPATQTVLTFDRAFKFKPGNLDECNPASLFGQTSTGARSICGDAQVGQGSAVVTRLDGVQLPAVVSAFNGVPSGGNPVILLHTDVAGVTTKPILTGALNGTVLTVTVPVTPGTVITHFDTSIDQIRVKKPNKKKGKPAQYYVSAKCNDGSWNHSETTTFTDGSTKTSEFSQKCKKKSKKKK